MTNTPRIDLVWLGAGTPPAWAMGSTFVCAATPEAVSRLVDDRLRDSEADAWLFWDAGLGAPDSRAVAQAFERPGDVWHAGLRLGTAGAPVVVDFVQPVWMLNCDPSPEIEATSWRLSLRACLVRTEVLRRLGGPRPGFATLDAAALELGHRYVSRGALTRHVPSLVPDGADAEPVRLAFDDEARFASCRYGRMWTRWVLGRALLSGHIGSLSGLRAALRAAREPVLPQPEPLARPLPPAPSATEVSVTILIPTLKRQRYIRTVLDQLRRQTVRPLEILIVDQTPVSERDTAIASDFADLPLRIIYRDSAGQCSSRNQGLQQARGEYVLFLDDDDEVRPDLVASHLRNLELASGDVSCGVAHEDGAGPLPPNFRFTRASDVFPTNNTMIRRSLLERSGLLDLAYERGQRADGDLGMRVYLSGALMVLNPEVAVIHRHAAEGGLREHKARVITYASSRQHLTVRHLPTPTEIYLSRRYYTDRQVREALWLRVFATFAMRSGLVGRALKAAVAAVSLPSTLWSVRASYHAASRLLERFPQISALGDAPGDRT